MCNRMRSPLDRVDVCVGLPVSSRSVAKAKSAGKKSKKLKKGTKIKPTTTLDRASPVLYKS